MDALFSQSASIALAVIRRIVQRRELAEDVLQDTFALAWRHRDQFDERRGSELSWLLGIARSRALDALRADGNRQRYERDRLHETPATTPADSTDVIGRDTLRRALQELPAAQRSCIELAYFGGFTQSEIAFETGMPLGTVKANVRRGLERLARSFAGAPSTTLPVADFDGENVRAAPDVEGPLLEVVADR